MMKNQQGSAALQIVWVIAGIVLIIAAFLLVKDARPGQAEKFSTPYQAVTLANGVVYYGKLEGYGTPRPVLTSVYVVVSQTNPDTKQIARALVKLDKVEELYQPDRMYLNPNQISNVQPVNEQSQVAKLIAQAK